MKYPLILLSHRRREFLESAIRSLTVYAEGVGDIMVVDDSGDPEHHAWLESMGFPYACSSPDGSHVGYLGAMQTAWEVARQRGSHVILWEEDFVLAQYVDFNDCASLLFHDGALAQVNLQRQPVYRIERRLGYMESHLRRGYGLRTRATEDIAWVERRKPFTTNPGLIRAEVFDTDWPTRRESDMVQGGAEPAMSLRLESLGYKFGWLGNWNSPQTHHAGTEMKTGKGY